MADVDPLISAAMLRIQAALAGVDMQTALNALAIQAGVMAVLGADNKGDAFAVVRAGAKQSQQIVHENWGRPDLELVRRQMRGETVQ